MAINDFVDTKFKNGKTLKHREFVFDSNDEIDNLPGINDCLPGSLAISTENGDLYILSSSGEWNKVGG